MKGTVELSQLRYIIRDHDMGKFTRMKELFGGNRRLPQREIWGRHGGADSEGQLLQHEGTDLAGDAYH